MSLITYLNSAVVKDNSIEGIKIKDGSITSSKIDSSVASKKYVDNTIANIAVAQSISITWSDLKAKRDASELTPGMQYRITDYTCTTTQDATTSAGHVFDIIVTADDESTLNEVARAAKHEGDSYFANNDLNAWKIWYCLDNDNTRFGWADSTNGKGVIYRMIDEFNNDVPYDFKNIQFYRQLDKDKRLWSIISEDNTGVPCYTFSSVGDSFTIEFTDMSLSISNYVYSNVIKNCNIDGYYGEQVLNNNCFFGTYCYGNIFEVDSSINTFGESCSNNTFGNYCYSNTFGNYCGLNTFGHSCNSNTFGDECSKNTFGNMCSINTFGNECSINTFGNECSTNTFGSDCDSNTFGNNCRRNSFGNNCSYIKFASDSSAETKYTYYQNNHFGDGCQYILFKGAETASSSAQVQNYNFAQGLQGTSGTYLTIDGVRNRAFETKVAQNSNGELKIYCEADLIK